MLILLPPASTGAVVKYVFCRCCLLWLYMPAIDRSLSDCRYEAEGNIDWWLMVVLFALYFVSKG